VTVLRTGSALTAQATWHSMSVKSMSVILFIIIRYKC